MSNINNQTQDLYSIESVQDLDHEDAATVSGGSLDFSDLRNGKGKRLNGLTRSHNSLGSFNNKATWYDVHGPRSWYAWSGKNFTGKRFLLKGNTKGNLRFSNNNIESVSPVA